MRSKEMSKYELLIESFERRMTIQESNRFHRSNRNEQILLFMYQVGVVSMHILSQCEFLKPKSCSVVMKRLEERGLVRSHDQIYHGNGGKYKVYGLSKKGYNYINEQYDLESIFGHGKYRIFKKKPSYLHDLNVAKVVTSFLINPSIHDIKVELEYEVHKEERVYYKDAIRVDARIIANGKEFWIEQDNRTQYRSLYLEKLESIGHHCNKDITVIYTIDMPLTTSGRKEVDKIKEELKEITNKDFYNYFFATVDLDKNRRLPKQEQTNTYKMLYKELVHKLTCENDQKELKKAERIYKALLLLSIYMTDKHHEAETLGELLDMYNDYVNGLKEDFRVLESSLIYERFYTKSDYFFGIIEELEDTYLYDYMLSGMNFYVIPLMYVDHLLHNFFSFSTSQEENPMFTYGMELLVPGHKNIYKPHYDLPIMDIDGFKVKPLDYYEPSDGSRNLIMGDMLHNLSERLRFKHIFKTSIDNYIATTLVYSEDYHDKVTNYCRSLIGPKDNVVIAWFPLATSFVKEVK